MAELVKVGVDPIWAAHALGKEIERHTQFCRKNPLSEDSVPLWTLVSGGMQITWAILLLERAMKQLLCFDGKDVYKNHNLSQLYAKLDNSTCSYVEKAFNAYVILYPNANVKSLSLADAEGGGRSLAGSYADARKLLAGISSQERYIKWRYPEFYPEVKMDITNVHLILEIATAVSDALLTRVIGRNVRGRNSVGRRLMASIKKVFDEKLEKLMLRLEERGDDASDLPADVINSWLDEHGGFLQAFVDYLLKRPSVDVYRHEGLSHILDDVVNEVASSNEPENVDKRQFLTRVHQDDFNFNVLLLR